MVDHVMLVDDNDTDNFIHQRVIELTGFAKNIIVKSSGKTALEYLENNKNDLEKLPNIIFLGLGWCLLRMASQERSLGIFTLIDILRGKRKAT